jgi:hypothetical protein
MRDMILMYKYLRRPYDKTDVADRRTVQNVGHWITVRSEVHQQSARLIQSFEKRNIEHRPDVSTYRRHTARNEDSNRRPPELPRPTGALPQRHPASWTVV